MTINLQVKLNSVDITNKVVSYTREKHLCTSVGLVDITLVADSLSPRVWDTVEIYEEGIKKGSYFLYSVAKVEANGSIQIQGQDASKKLSDYFITDQYLIDYLSYSKTWITKFLNEAGVSHHYNVSGNGTPLSNNTNLGIQSAYDTVMTLLQQSGWYMYFDPDNEATIGKLSTKSSSADITVDDSQIITLNINDNDSMLRNRAVVWGAGNPNDSTWVFADISVNTPYNIDSNDKRAIVLANSNIPSIAEATKVANQMIKEFARITDEITIEVAGFLDVEVGDTVQIKSKYRSGLAMLTSLGCTVSSNGVITTLVLNERCPRLFAYYFVGTGPGGDAKVYIGTEHDGIYYKDFYGATWSGFNDGLTSLDVQDLYIQNGIFGAVVGYEFYYRSLGELAWNKFTYSGSIPDAVGTMHDVQYLRPVALAMDKTSSNMHVGFNTSFDPNRSWILDITASGTLAASYPIYTGFISEQTVVSGSMEQTILDLDNAGAYDIANVSIGALLVPEVGVDGDWGYFNVSNANAGGTSNYYTHLASSGIWSVPVYHPELGRSIGGIWSDSQIMSVPILDDSISAIPFIWENGPDDIGKLRYISQGRLYIFDRYYIPWDEINFEGDYYDWQNSEELRPVSVTAHEGTLVWNAGYGYDIDNTLTRVIDLTGKTTADLNFWIYYFIEDGFDYGYVQASTDGTTWTDLITPFTGSNGPAWEFKSLSLDAYVGDFVFIRFRYTTDGSVLELGIAVDEISVIADSVTIFFDGAETLLPGWTATGWSRTEGFTSSPIDYISLIFTGRPVALYKIDRFNYRLITNTETSGENETDYFRHYTIEIEPSTLAATCTQTSIYYVDYGTSGSDLQDRINNPSFNSFTNKIECPEPFVYANNYLVYFYERDYWISDLVPGASEQWKFDVYAVTINILTGTITEQIVGSTFYKKNYIIFFGSWVDDSNLFYLPIRLGGGHIVLGRFRGYPGDDNHAIDSIATIVNTFTGQIINHSSFVNWEAPPPDTETWSFSSMGGLLVPSRFPETNEIGYAMGDFTSTYTHENVGWFQMQVGAEYYKNPGNHLETVWIVDRFSVPADSIVGSTGPGIYGPGAYVMEDGDADGIPDWLNPQIYGTWWPAGCYGAGKGTPYCVHKRAANGVKADIRDAQTLQIVSGIPDYGVYNVVARAFPNQDDIDYTIYIEMQRSTGSYDRYIAGVDYDGNITKIPGVLYAGSTYFGDFTFPVNVFGDSYLVLAPNSNLAELRTVKKETFEYGAGLQKDILRRNGPVYTTLYHPLGVPKVEISQKVPPTVLYTPVVAAPNFPIVSQTNAINSFYYNFTEPMYPILDARTFYLSDYPTFTTMSGVVASGSYISPLFIATVGDGGTIHIIDGNVIGPFGILATLSGNLTHIETTNVDDPPFFFVSASGAFYQQNSGSSAWLDYSATLPSSAITIIRVDDAI